MQYFFAYSLIHLSAAATVIHSVIFSRRAGRIRKPHTVTQSAILACLMFSFQDMFSTRSDYLYMFATILMPMLSEYRSLFQLSNAAGIHRAVYFDSICLWQKAVIISIHMGLFISNIDKHSLSTLSDIFQGIAYISQWKLIRLYKQGHLNNLIQSCSLDQRKFIYDTKEQFFLLRAVIRFALPSLLPAYIVQILFGNLKFVKAILSSHLIISFGNIGNSNYIQICMFAFLLLITEILDHRCIYISNFIRDEWKKVNQALEIELKSQILNSRYLVKFSEKSSFQCVRSYISNIEYLFNAIAGIIELIVVLPVIYHRVRYLIIIHTLVCGIFKAMGWLAVRFFTIDTRDTKSYVVKNFKDINADIIYDNIRYIKYYGWEGTFVNDKKIQSSKSNYFKNGIYEIKNCIGRITYATSACIATCILISQQPSILAGTAISELNEKKELLKCIYNYIYRFIAAYKQIRILLTSNAKVESYLKEECIPTILRSIFSAEPPRIVMDNCTFTWNSQMSSHILNSITLSTSNNDLIAVSGITGSGKSTLLLAMCGEVELFSGSGKSTGKIGYLEQNPWIIEDTVKSNILFGHELDEELYNQVIYACALTGDLKQWPDGDETTIFENSISGGQRARIALARTLYSQADIYILDDPLAAVDAYVKRHIMENVILGMLKSKLCVVASNTNHIVPYANKVITLENGLASVVEQHPKVYVPIANPTYSATTAVCKNNDNTRIESHITPPKKTNNDYSERSIFDNLRYIWGICGIYVIAIPMLIGLTNHIFGFIANGNIFQLYKMYDSAVATKHMIIIYYIWIIAKDIVECMLYMLQTCFKNTLSVKYGKQSINYACLRGLIYAPLSIFDEQSKSELSFKYNNATSKLYDQLYSLVSRHIPKTTHLILSIVYLMVKVPLLILAMPTVIYLSSTLKGHTNLAKKQAYSFYRQKVEEFSKLESKLGKGRIAIRACGRGKYFKDQWKYLMKQSSQTLIYNFELSSIYLEIPSILKLIIDFIACISVALYCHTFGKSPSFNDLYLIRSLIDQVYMDMQTISKIPDIVSELSANISDHYSLATIKPEAPYIINSNRAPMSWPQQGKIVFTDFSLKYQPHLQLVLKNINLTINPGEKIGIVGRTGAGKSSLVKSLFRLVPEGTTGSITIDGLDISSIGLGDLRPRLGIIPQESTILNGSYRENLDPMNEFSIEDIWAAAIKSQLVEVVKQPRDYTNLETEEYYDNAAKLKQWRQAGYLQKIKLLLTGKKPNFESQIQQRRTLLDMDVCGPRNQLSNGQKQLFSLCRLLMHQHKIAILDEATASMDLEADRKLQKIIHTELKECTVLTIAHRLETVMNSDRIIVIHQGEVVEIGAPAELAQKQGHFAELLKCNNFGE